MDGRLVADHDHDTGLLRGLLCYSCNQRDGQCRSQLFAVSDPAVAAYLADPPAGGLGWVWDLPDWWGPADTGAVRASRATVLDHLTNGAAIDRLQLLDLPAIS